MELKKYNVTVRRFNPHDGMESGEDFVLPVNSPDAEHAAASTMSNLISLTLEFRLSNCCSKWKMPTGTIRSTLT